MNTILDGLNPEQLRAVKHNKGPLLLLAGAGSGKTRVLTHRIAYLIEEHDVNPWNILALTFTNKAATEMRERVDRIVGFGSDAIWVSTFHSTCVRILRRYIKPLGYTRNFTIYDSDDQKTLMREVCKYLSIDTKKTSEKQLLSAISSAKDECMTPEEFAQNAGNDLNQKRYAQAYTEYQNRLKKNNALDFDDIIVKTVDLFRTQPEVLQYYHNRFKYVMVDEYQDTNTAQFMLISLLSVTTNDEGQEERNICVVGDDDQSIYKFRGANIYNILNFEKVYKDATVIKLEQNYRSTKNILEAANEVIQNNSLRKEKALWCDQEKGDPIFYTQFSNEYEEADSIVKDIRSAVINGEADYHDFAVLYRTNAQSRIFEEKLVQNNIPYKIVGAVNFYARREIKDLMCYLKTIDNGMDDLAVKRVINVPKRGIGLTSIDRIMEYEIQNGITFYEALKSAEYINGLGRAVSKISPFVSLIEILKSKLAGPSYSLENLLREILEATGYLRLLVEEHTDEADNRIQNIEEFINRIIVFEQSKVDEPATLSAFLEEIALVADIDNVDPNASQVLLMTLHSAKGLEFPYVYMSGMEENIFPGTMSIFSPDPTDIEEERRLCYVGITRARKKLSLSCARQRMKNGEMLFNKPSRFIGEIPRYLLKQNMNSSDRSSLEHQFSKKVETNAPKGFSPDSLNPFKGNPFIQKGFGGVAKKQTNAVSFSPDYQKGDTVKHVKFGTGIVQTLSVSGSDYDVVVEFNDFGNRKMKASFAKLKKI